MTPGRKKGEGDQDRGSKQEGCRGSWAESLGKGGGHTGEPGRVTSHTREGRAGDTDRPAVSSRCQRRGMAMSRALVGKYEPGGETLGCSEGN